VLSVAVLVSLALPASGETSDVVRFTLPDVVDGRWDIELVLFHRDGSFHHGYARVPGRDNVSHRVDVTPSRPIQWVKADGTELEVPDKLRGYYSYKQPEFKRMRALYAQGKIRIDYPIPTPPIGWKNGKLTGHVDVLIAPVNTSNGTGRSPSDIAFRVRVNAKGDKPGSISGSAVWWTYRERDDDYGHDAEKTKVSLQNAEWDADYWAPEEGTGLSADKTWPQARGPRLTGSAIDCDRSLVDNLDDARLVWVGEETIGGGRGAVLSRGGFAMYPYAWQNIGYGGFAGVTVADGKVFQYVLHPDEDLVAESAKIADNVYVELGADPRTMANKHGLMRDTVLCLDARTGKRLWWFKSEKTFGNVKSGKGGIGMTACYHKGRVYARGHRGLYCLDAATGKLLWKKGGAEKGDAKVGYGPSHGWSHDESPVMIDGVLVMGHGKDESLAGVSPADGSLLWTHANVKGQNAVPTKVTLDGREYIVVSGKETADLSLIEPKSGKILWQSDLLGPNHGPLLVNGDIVCGNSVDRKEVKFGRAAAVRVTRGGAKRAWVSKDAAYPASRAVPVAHKGHFYVDTRKKFYCLDARNGTLAGTQPHIYRMSWGSHNWTWTITSNRKVFTSGVLMFSTAADGFRKLPGRIALDLAGGYTCPIKPAIADGRLFCRLADRIVCYDLRKPDDLTARTLELIAPEAFTSSLAEKDTVKLRVRSTEKGVPRVSASWPEVVGPEAQKIAEKWVAWYKKPLHWRTYPAPDLTANLQTGKLAGKVKVPMGWHFEYWTFEDGEDGLRAVRSLPAVNDPLKVSGKVSGRTFEGKDGQVYVLKLHEAATQLQRSDRKQTVTVVVIDGEKGRRAWAMAGRINGMAHEADPSKLTIRDGRVSGKVTVLFRDDPYFHLNADEWTGVAATYDVDTKVRSNAVTGKHSGRMGHAWQKELKLRASPSK
jgi:outer membrane protein assembly factor BamB